MCMTKPITILEPISEHTVHANVSKPDQSRAGDTRVLSRNATTQQEDRRRLGVHHVVEDRSSRSVGQVADHAEIGKQEAGGEHPP